MKQAAANGTSAGGSSSAGSIAAYDKLLQDNLQPFMEQAAALGGEVSTALQTVTYCWLAAMVGHVGHCAAGHMHVQQGGVWLTCGVSGLLGM